MTTTTTSLTVKSSFVDDRDVVMISVQGSLDSHTYSALESKIEKLIYHGEAKIIIDLSGVDFVSSAGVNVFLTARRKAMNEHGTVVLMNPSASVTHVFALLPENANAMLTVAKDLEEALRVFARTNL